MVTLSSTHHFLMTGLPLLPLQTLVLLAMADCIYAGWAPTESKLKNGTYAPLSHRLATYLRTRFDTQDALYDVAWSEVHENQAVVGSGDGSVKLFDINLDQYPIQSWQEHRREVYSVAWNLVAKDTIASSSWDGTIKIVS